MSKFPGMKISEVLKTSEIFGFQIAEIDLADEK